jgi:hypothetical protein
VDVLACYELRLSSAFLSRQLTPQR